mmetsp:Transcript_2/g.2  ORF Transcript_2/g.2 Transcript_2/m.2 type:complete len:372 (+) Transcript_2:324-1439(+)|eukprot:CAMPEP_0184511964 /NCGR_PEP_ID=MMETSP0198_2-20121128/2629_1 /TAXON_ID=1112570 /ORGANISM="Thraustochytrium sp., Strain LLF1b" /LENGTH=371 /DNA_ID=CAMNT_0026901959 /DNA_START=247 /DNA_END=1362 /DNA_ORIENTATION=+
MSAEVMFVWKGSTVNLKLSRSVVRFLAEQHGRLAEVGPTQCLRDILDWFQHCDPGKDESFRALEEKYGANSDFDNVCSFLREYDYEELKRAYPKQCGSLWMAVRGVLRRMNQNRSTPTPTSTMLSTASAESTRNPVNAAQNVREGADNVAFEILMLLSNPDMIRLSDSNREHLSHVEQTLCTALEDVRLILRLFENADTPMKSEPTFNDDNFHGGSSGSEYGNGSNSPDSGFSGPSGSSPGADSGFAPGGGGGGNFGWFSANNISQRLADVSIQSPRGQNQAAAPASKATSTRSKSSKRSSTRNLAVQAESSVPPAAKRVSMRNRASKRFSLGLQKASQDINKRLSSKSTKSQSQRPTLCPPSALKAEPSL